MSPATHGWQKEQGAVPAGRYAAIDWSIRTLKQGWEGFRRTGETPAYGGLGEAQIGACQCQKQALGA